MNEARNGGTGGNGPDDALLRSKALLDRTRRVRDAVRAATEARRGIESRMSQDDYTMSFLFDNPDYPEYSTAKYKERKRENEAALREARAREAEAVEEFARATEELGDATVEPRVEGMKLRFETRRLQATLSAGVLVGAATVTEVLLPPNPGYAYLMYLAYAAFIVSVSGCLSDMNRIAIYVENPLVGGRTEVEEPGWREKVSRAMMYLNQRSLAFGLLLFVLFAMLNLT